MRNVTEAELKNLYNAVFTGEEEFCRRFFERFYKKSRVFCRTENGKAVSALHLLDITLSYKSRDYKAGYIFAVGTLEEYRGRGYASSIVKEAVDFCRKEHYDFIFLIAENPLLFDFYSRFGFEKASDETETVLMPEENGTVKAEETGADELSEALNRSEGLHIKRDFRNTKDLLYVYGAGAYTDGLSFCAAYKAGGYAVIPKAVGASREKLCRAVCAILGTEKAVVADSANAMLLNLCKDDIPFAEIDFILN